MLSKISKSYNYKTKIKKYKYRTNIKNPCEITSWDRLYFSERTLGYANKFSKYIFVVLSL